MPRPYLLSVHSQPTKLSNEIWTQWYLEEHIRDMVYFQAAKTGAFYRGSSEVFTSNSFPNDNSESMNYLALYQTDRKGTNDSAEVRDKVRKTSNLWTKEGCEGLSTFDVGEFVIQEGTLVEVLGSYEHNEAVAPHIVHVKMAGEEVEGKLQFEHVNAVSILDGYRRTLLYRFPSPSQESSSVHLIHEFEHLDSSPLGAVKKEMETIEPTKDCSFQLRSYELLDSEGFGGMCRKPERL